MQKWKGIPGSVCIDKCFIYKQFNEEYGRRTIFALNVHSDDILNAREDFGVMRKPEKYTMHVSLLEKKLLWNEIIWFLLNNKLGTWVSYIY